MYKEYLSSAQSDLNNVTFMIMPGQCRSLTNESRRAVISKLKSAEAQGLKWLVRSASLLTFKDLLKGGSEKKVEYETQENSRFPVTDLLCIKPAFVQSRNRCAPTYRGKCN